MNEIVPWIATGTYVRVRLDKTPRTMPDHMRYGVVSGVVDGRGYHVTHPGMARYGWVAAELEPTPFWRVLWARLVTIFRGVQ